MNATRAAEGAKFDPAPLIEDYWDVTDIYNVDRLADHTDKNLAAVLDYTGVDIIADCQDNLLTFGKRHRPRTEFYPDLSIRDSEMENWRRAVGNMGLLPDVFIFGVHDGDFRYLDIYFIDLRQLIRGFSGGVVDFERHGNAYYISDYGDYVIAHFSDLSEYNIRVP